MSFLHKHLFANLVQLRLCEQLGRTCTGPTNRILMHSLVVLIQLAFIENFGQFCIFREKTRKEGRPMTR